jgi:hypothetical protein
LASTYRPAEGGVALVFSVVEGLDRGLQTRQQLAMIRMERLFGVDHDASHLLDRTGAFTGAGTASTGIQSSTVVP